MKIAFMLLNRLQHLLKWNVHQPAFSSKAQYAKSDVDDDEEGQEEEEREEEVLDDNGDILEGFGAPRDCGSRVKAKFRFYESDEEGIVEADQDESDEDAIVDGNEGNSSERQRNINRCVHFVIDSSTSVLYFILLRTNSIHHSYNRRSDG